MKTNEERIEEIDKKISVLYDSLNALDNETMDSSYEQFLKRREPYYNQMGKLDREKRMIMVPTFSELPDYGDVMPLNSFIEGVKDEMFTDYDGFGYYIKNKQESNIKILPSDVKHKSLRSDFDTIIWYNK